MLLVICSPTRMVSASCFPQFATDEEIQMVRECIPIRSVLHGPRLQKLSTRGPRRLTFSSGNIDPPRGGRDSSMWDVERVWPMQFILCQSHGHPWWMCTLEPSIEKTLIQNVWNQNDSSGGIERWNGLRDLQNREGIRWRSIQATPWTRL